MSRHHLVIYSGMNSRPDSSSLTCLSLGGGRSIIDNILERRDKLVVMVYCRQGPRTNNTPLQITQSPLLLHIKSIGPRREGRPNTWTMHMIGTIDKSRDPSIMIGHILTKLYKAVLEAKLNTSTKVKKIQVLGQAEFMRVFCTKKHTLH